MRSLNAGPVRLALLIAAIAVAIPAAAQQPDPAPTAAVHVDSVEINLAAQPRFTFAVNAGVVLRFEAVSFNGQQLLHIWAYARTEQASSKITRTSLNSALIDEAEFQRAVTRALTSQHTERRLSYNRRLTTRLS
jgi:hypothetical protein